MTIHDDFHNYLAQRGQELAATKTVQQTEYERRQQLEAEGGELFTGLFAQLDENNQEQVVPAVPSDPAEVGTNVPTSTNDFNKFFGL